MKKKSTIPVFFTTFPFTDGLGETQFTSVIQRAGLADRGRLTDVAQIRARFFDTLAERLLTFSNPDTGVIELRVGDECAITI